MVIWGTVLGEHRSLPTWLITILATAALLATAAGCSSGSESAQDPGRPSVPLTGPDDQVAELPGFGPVAQPQFAGYSSVTEQPCAGVSCDGQGEAGLCYWFVGTKVGYDRAPTIIWTNGGPGSSSFWGFFLENGPYEVGDSGQLRERQDAWNDTANYMIFEQPMSVGLSFAPSGGGPDSGQPIPANVAEGTQQWYSALANFLQAHPEVAANPIYLAGESYGGTYVPLLAQAILEGNERAGREVVRLGGTIIAAGWVDPVVQQSMDTTYALSHGLITAADKEQLDATYESCRVAVEAQSPSSVEANDVCSQVKDGIARISGRYLLNLGVSADPPTDPVVAYLNRADVRAAIHARPLGTFDFFSEAIGDRYEVGVQDSYRPVVQSLLDAGVPTMVISGLDDATDVNFMGTELWLDLLTGPRADTFHSAPTTQWKADDDVLGYLQQGDGLTWVKVLNAGHLAVLDQPLLIDLIDSVLLQPTP